MLPQNVSLNNYVALHSTSAAHTSCEAYMYGFDVRCRHFESSVLYGICVSQTH